MTQVLDQHFLAALMDTVPDRIYFKDLEGRFLAVSKAFLDYVNFSDLEQIRGKTDYDIFQDEHAQDAWNDEQQVIRTGNPIVGKIEKEVLHDGTIRWVSTTKAPMKNDQGEIVGTCGISRDITEEHVREEKLREYAEVLAQRQQEAEQEMALAREVQSALLPDTFPIFPSLTPLGENALEFHYRYLPAGAVGGDFYSVQKLSETKAGILISDVMGHGPHAALVTAILKVLVEELNPLASDPGAFLNELNRRLCQVLKRVENCLFVTACYVVLDIADGSIAIANASHPLPFLLHRKNQSLKRVGPLTRVNNFSLGLLEDSTYEVFRESIQPGNSLLLYTDGLSDICGSNGKNCRDQDLFEIVKESSTLEADYLLDEIILRVREKSGSTEFQDDVCVLSVDWNEAA